MVEYLAYRVKLPFTNVAIFFEYPSVVQGYKLLDIEHVGNETFVWVGRFHAIIEREEKRHDRAVPEAGS